MKEGIVKKSLYFRKSKETFYIEFLYKGKKFIRNTKKKNKTQAEKELPKIYKIFIEKQNKKEYEKLTGEKLSILLNHYLEENKNHFQNAHLKILKRTINNFINYIGDKGINEYSPDHISQYFIYLKKKNICAKTINNYMSNIKSFFNSIYHQEIQKNNIFTNKYWLKNKKKKQPIILDKNEVEILVKTMEKSLPLRYKVFFMTILFTGMRIEEVRGFCRNNINFNKKLYSVQTKKEGSDKEIQYQLKSKAAYREIPLLFDFHINILKKYLEEDIRDFPFQDVSYSWMRVQKKKLEELSGLKFRTYDLRHTFASMLIDMRGKDGKSAFTPKQIQVIMGHESITTTFNIYGHLMNRDYNTQITIANSYLDL